MPLAAGSSPAISGQSSHEPAWAPIPIAALPGDLRRDLITMAAIPAIAYFSVLIMRGNAANAAGLYRPGPGIAHVHGSGEHW